ncbi:uncharacterized protein LOC131248808 isoform X2 [Magnolia sinica]|uniref:uncharacterized protein LOC131248808 isoform X2 n=1 Tax=Magnolia sinica TaxID=86752 RepID=UPI002657DD17|nr:uncharacterized protein LOC131248808 isoform X2 [Magnolia sinica]
MDVDKIAETVGPSESGEGLPFAPQDWPNPGDKWKWKVGNRKSASGFWIDRYLSPPDRIQKAHSRSQRFASRPAVINFLKKEFPGTDVDAFFASFSWKVPCTRCASASPVNGNDSSDMHPVQLLANEHAGSESTFGDNDCKAGNKMCSLRVQPRTNSLEAMACDICCTESGFCRDCCCILCCKTIDWEYGGYSFVKCEARVKGNYICGHIAHVNCALRSYMAGTVGGSIGLDVEYYCRRCDNKTNLISHVERFLETCQSVDSRDGIEKILNLGLCILRGSQQTSAKNLLNHIELVLTKLKSGIYVEDIWKVDDDSRRFSAALSGPLDVLSNQVSLDFIAGSEPSHELDDTRGRGAQTPVYITSDHHIASLKFENEIDRALESLRKSQEEEYKVAEQKLYGHKDLLLGLYQKLDMERSELAKHTASPAGNDSDALLANVLSRVEQIKREVIKLRHMVEIANGFGRTPKAILKEHFGLPIED